MEARQNICVMTHEVPLSATCNVRSSSDVIGPHWWSRGDSNPREPLDIRITGCRRRVQSSSRAFQNAPSTLTPRFRFYPNRLPSFDQILVRNEPGPSAPGVVTVPMPIPGGPPHIRRYWCGRRESNPHGTCPNSPSSCRGYRYATSAKSIDGARGGTRTPTAFRPPAPEAGASTNSATRASSNDLDAGAVGGTRTLTSSRTRRPQRRTSTVPPRPHPQHKPAAIWCASRDSNSHGLSDHTVLSGARLPVSPDAHQIAAGHSISAKAPDPSIRRSGDGAGGRIRTCTTYDHLVLSQARLPFRHARVIARSTLPSMLEASDPKVLHHGARPGNRTPTTHRSAGFEPAASTVPPHGRHDGRGRGNRTHGLCYPKAALYQAELAPGTGLRHSSGSPSGHSTSSSSRTSRWSGRQELNLRPSGPKPDALPD